MVHEMILLVVLFFGLAIFFAIAAYYIFDGDDDPAMWYPIKETFETGYRYFGILFWVFLVAGIVTVVKIMLNGSGL